MSLFKGSKEIEELYIGGQEIAEMYHGSDLIFENEKYTPGQVVIINTTPGENSFSVLDNGFYQVSIVGGGGGGAGGLKGVPVIGYGSFNLGAGGSGSYIKIICKLRKNNNYNYTVGAGGSGYSAGSSHTGGSGGIGGATVFYGFSANGGGGGTCTGSGNTATGGSGGTCQLPSDIPSIVRDYSSINGNAGGTRISNSPAYPGTSVYGGYGGGGRAYGSVGRGSYGDNGGNGAIEVVYLGKKYTPTARTLTMNTNVPANIRIDGELVAENVTTYDVSMVFGQTVSYEISADNYITQSGSYTWTSESSTDTLNVTLVLTKYDFTINSNVESSITINGVTEVDTTSTAEIPHGSTATWSVAATGYTTQSGSQTVTQDTILNITLVPEVKTFAIHSNVANSSITINGVTTTGNTASVQVNYGTIINWEVSAVGYVTQSGNEVMTEDKSLSVVLREDV